MKTQGSICNFHFLNLKKKEKKKVLRVIKLSSSSTFLKRHQHYSQQAECLILQLWEEAIWAVTHQPRIFSSPDSYCLIFSLLILIWPKCKWRIRRAAFSPAHMLWLSIWENCQSKGWCSMWRWWWWWWIDQDQLSFAKTLSILRFKLYCINGQLIVCMIATYLLTWKHHILCAAGI